MRLAGAQSRLLCSAAACRLRPGCGCTLGCSFLAAASWPPVRRRRRTPSRVRSMAHICKRKEWSDGLEGGIASGMERRSWRGGYRARRREGRLEGARGKQSEGMARNDSRAGVCVCLYRRHATTAFPRVCPTQSRTFWTVSLTVSVCSMGTRILSVCSQPPWTCWTFTYPSGGVQHSPRQPGVTLQSTVRVSLEAVQN